MFINLFNFKFYFYKVLNKNYIYIFIITAYSGSMSLYEFINSFRESKNSTHPELRSKTTKEALAKIKEMKNEIGEGILKTK